MHAHAHTLVRSETRTHTTRRAAIAKIARITLVASGALAGALGSAVMRGHVEVLQIHETLGDLAVLSLWTLAVLAARAGVRARVWGAALGWGAVELSLAGLQKLALGPTAHTAAQILHVASSIGVMAGGMLLARAVLQRESSGRSAR